jgi:hypothetical protein
MRRRYVQTSTSGPALRFKVGSLDVSVVVCSSHFLNQDGILSVPGYTFGKVRLLVNFILGLIPKAEEQSRRPHGTILAL